MLQPQAEMPAPMSQSRSDHGPSNYEEIARSADYLNLVKRRARFSWALTALMLIVYFGYILLIAFNRALLATPVGGGVTTLGIPVGIGVILIGIALTGVYVVRANRHFDVLERTVRGETAA